MGGDVVDELAEGAGGGLAAVPAAGVGVDAWRLDLLPPALPEQFLADPVGALFLTAHVPGQPRRQVLGVGNAALPESGHPADLGAVPLDLPPVPATPSGSRRRQRSPPGSRSPGGSGRGPPCPAPRPSHTSRYRRRARRPA